MTLADLKGSVIEAKVYTRIDHLLINSDWQPFETGRSRTRTDIDPVTSLHESCHQSPSSPWWTTKALRAKCAHIDCREHMHSIACALNLIRKTSSFLHLCYQFSIMVELNQSRLMSKQIKYLSFVVKSCKDGRYFKF